MSDAPPPVSLAETILTVDFGVANTRVALFDVVEGVYRFLASCEAPSTIDAPYREASEGMRHALADLQAITGRTFFDESGQFTIPSTADGRGVDFMVATTSAGPAVRTVLVGLLPDVSLDNAQQIAVSHYTVIQDTFSLGDARTEAQRIDAVLAAQPDLILITGGTDNGASQALTKIMDTVKMACHLLPPEHRIKVLFAGNSALQAEVNEKFGAIATVHHAPNLQPELGVTDLVPGRTALGQVIEALRYEQIGGFTNIGVWTGGRIYPTAQAESNVIHFFSHQVGPNTGVMNVHVGSASTTIIAGFGDVVSTQVRSDLGVGIHAAAVLKETPIEQLLRWVPFEMTPDAMRDFIHNKAIYPHTIPATLEDAHLENALTRQVMAAALRRARRAWPRKAKGRAGQLPWFEIIFGTGAALARVPQPGVTAMLLLDALQPVGVTQLVLDPYHLGAALGGLAHLNPTAVVQLIDSGAFQSLGSVFSILGSARVGEVVCTATLKTEEGDKRVEVKFGALEILPLGANESGTLTLQPRAGIDVGYGPGRGIKNKSVGDGQKISGGLAGLIIDARGRPLAWPKDPAQRRERVAQWYWKAAAGAARPTGAEAKS